jgi:hypothetical protein
MAGQLSRRVGVIAKVRRLANLPRYGVSGKDARVTRHRGHFTVIPTLQAG